MSTLNDRLRRIDHIGIAVLDLDAAVRFYQSLFGRGPESTGTVVEQQVRTAFFAAGESSVELLQPTADDSPVAKFLARRGPGLHHICFAVADLERALDDLRRQGMCLIDETPRTGAHGKRIAFVHPKSAGGVLIELAESQRTAACPPHRSPHDAPGAQSS